MEADKRAEIGTTVTEFIFKSQRKNFPTATGAFTSLVLDVVLACKKISALINRGQLVDVYGSASTGENVQGEEQKKLDVLSNEILKKCLKRNDNCAALLTEEEEEIIKFKEAINSPYIVASDPLDGSSNIDLNMPVGTIFSILKRNDMTQAVSDADFLVRGEQQLAAGYCLYGSSTQLVLTLGAGSGTHIFTLDADVGEFILTRQRVQIPRQSSEFAINMSNRRHWNQSILLWVEDMERGADGVFGRNFNMRWVASLVAEVHRILTRGGIWLYPCDAKQAAAGKKGRIRLLYEAAPMALLVREAGGGSSLLPGDCLQFPPEMLHERVPICLGSAQNVAELDQRTLEHLNKKD